MMKKTPNFFGKSIELDVDEYLQIQPIAHALSTELRLQIMWLIRDRGMSVNEIAKVLEVPISTVALNVQVLEKANLITCESQPGVRGTQKLCIRKIDSILFQLWRKKEEYVSRRFYDMPVGCYSMAGDICGTCGLASYDQNVYMMDSPEAFFHPLHFQADLLWMKEGFVEYYFPKIIAPEELEYLEFSFEACSEAPGWRMEWRSDIYICVNGVEIGVWNCPSDFGGHRGLNNPEWWDESRTQHGSLVTWRIDSYGSMLNNEVVSKVRLKDLKLNEGSNVALRIGVHKDGEYSGGMNLFGAKFGDYAQNILMCCADRG